MGANNSIPADEMPGGPRHQTRLLYRNTWRVDSANRLFGACYDGNTFEMVDASDNESPVDEGEYDEDDDWEKSEAAPIHKKQVRRQHKAFHQLIGVADISPQERLKELERRSKSEQRKAKQSELEARNSRWYNKVKRTTSGRRNTGDFGAKVLENARQEARQRLRHKKLQHRAIQHLDYEKKTLE
ncbi:hypothetical protein P43SY_000603 [Pythium insidiosum]|uniref:Uncharacterized protein n=1 Tax=Pythium insidiosum TaxID=114742 RepID=A0AAD5Q7Q6_PYTIN|nr:hypothetical protein P43SY_000603 [Pythium insidiosum]